MNPIALYPNWDMESFLLLEKAILADTLPGGLNETGPVSIHCGRTPFNGGGQVVGNLLPPTSFYRGTVTPSRDNSWHWLAGNKR